MRLLDADKAPTGARLRGSCWTSIRSANLIERGRPSRAISPAPDGDTDTCFDAAGLAPMPDWHRAFDDPIPVADGRVLRTLHDAAHYATALRKAVQKQPSGRPQQKC
jgi:hypothetical protein